MYFTAQGIFIYNGSPIIRPLLGYGKPGFIRGVLSCEGYMTHSYREFGIWYCGLIRGVGGLW